MGETKRGDYPLPACPSSSIVQGILLWGVIGEVMEIKYR